MCIALPNLLSLNGVEVKHVALLVRRTMAAPWDPSWHHLSSLSRGPWGCSWAYSNLMDPNGPLFITALSRLRSDTAPGKTLLSHFCLCHRLLGGLPIQFAFLTSRINHLWKSTFSLLQRKISQRLLHFPFWISPAHLFKQKQIYRECPVYQTLCWVRTSPEVLHPSRMWGSLPRSKDSKTWKLDAGTTPGSDPSCRPWIGHPLWALVTKSLNFSHNVSLGELGKLNGIMGSKDPAKSLVIKNEN